MAKRKTPQIEDKPKEDPAFLFYPGAASEDTQFMNRLQRGCYFDLVKAQKKFRSFDIDEIKMVMGADFDTCWKALEIVLGEEDGRYYIKWLAIAIAEREAFSESRRQNRAGKTKGKSNKSTTHDNHMKNTSSTNEQHMVNEDVIENESEDVSGNELYGKCENFFHGDVPEDLVELAGMLRPMPRADEWQDYVQDAIETLGYTVKREQPCPYISKEGKRINGKIDLVVIDGSTEIGIELDYRQPRLKSIRKVEKFKCGMVLLRDPKIVERGEYSLNHPPPKIPAKTMVANTTFADCQLWTTQAISGNDEILFLLLKARGLHTIDLKQIAESHLGKVNRYAWYKKWDDQNAFRQSLVTYLVENYKGGDQKDNVKSKIDSIEL